MKDISLDINQQVDKAREKTKQLLSVINALCLNVNDIYLVDRKTETVTVIRQKGKAIGLEGKTGMKFGYDMAINSYIQSNVWVGDRDTMGRFMKLSNICRRLKDNESISIIYRVSQETVLENYRARCYRVGDGDTFGSIVFAFTPEEKEPVKTQNYQATGRDIELVQRQQRGQMYEARFEEAMHNHEFVVWCQPKFNSFTKTMTSAEALVRWKTADGKFISPGEFIPVFEADGLIVKLDEYVFKYVCERQKQLIDANMEPLPVSVNVSRATALNPGEAELYSNMIEEIGLPKKYVALELTESATVENSQISTIVDELKEAGFSLHMDDFGAGFSSLASLCSLPFDVLKLDKTLIDGIGNKRGDEVLRHIIELAHFCQMDVVAEGVEQESQYTFLKKLNCDTIQGYYFSKPLPFDEYLSLWQAQPAEESRIMSENVLTEDAGLGSLHITNDVRMQYLAALAGIYMTMHVIDLKEDTVVEFATTTNVKEHVTKVHNTAGQMKAAMTATVDPAYLDAVLEFTDLGTIVDRLKGKRTIAAEFVGKHFGWFQARFTTVTTDKDDNPEVIIYTTQVINADRQKPSVAARPEAVPEDETDGICRTDVLTGVYNRAAFDEDMKSLQQSNDLAVVMADINGLRGINENLGRPAGDELLWGLADCLNRAFGKVGRVYRLEKDYFCVIAYGSGAEIESCTGRFRDSAKSWMGDQVRTLSVSYGLVRVPEFPEMPVKDLIDEADRRRLEYKTGIKGTA